MDEKTIHLLLKTAKGREFYFQELAKEKRQAESLKQIKKNWKWSNFFPK